MHTENYASESKQQYGSVLEGLENLDKSLACLRELLPVLKDKLTRVLLTQEPHATPAEIRMEKKRCPLAEQIDFLNDSLTDRLAHLENILGRINV